MYRLDFGYTSVKCYFIVWEQADELENYNPFSIFT